MKERLKETMSENNETTVVGGEVSAETTKVEHSREETVELIREAMGVDEQIDALKEQVGMLLKERHNLLGEIAKRGVKRFAWKGTPLSVWRKGEGMFSLKGKKKTEDLDILSID